MSCSPPWRARTLEVTNRFSVLLGLFAAASLVANALLVGSNLPAGAQLHRGLRLLAYVFLAAASALFVVFFSGMTNLVAEGFVQYVVTAAPGPGPRYASAAFVALELMLVLGPVAIAMLLGISRPRRSQVEPGTVRLAAPPCLQRPWRSSWPSRSSGSEERGRSTAEHPRS